VGGGGGGCCSRLPWIDGSSPTRWVTPADPPKADPAPPPPPATASVTCCAPHHGTECARAAISWLAGVLACHCDRQERHHREGGCAHGAGIHCAGTWRHGLLFSGERSHSGWMTDKVGVLRREMHGCRSLKHGQSASSTGAPAAAARTFAPPRHTLATCRLPAQGRPPLPLLGLLCAILGPRLHASLDCRAVVHATNDLQAPKEQSSRWGRGRALVAAAERQLPPTPAATAAEDPRQASRTPAWCPRPPLGCPTAQAARSTPCT